MCLYMYISTVIYVIYNIYIYIYIYIYIDIDIDTDIDIDKKPYTFKGT